ncbi:MAG: hypothetical protein ACM3Q1_01575 [Bacteroidales bacterium]
MTAIRQCCADTPADAVAGSSGHDHDDAVRSQLAGRLRCASQLKCTQAVACSDDAMAKLRRVLGKST